MPGLARAAGPIAFGAPQLIDASEPFREGDLLGSVSCPSTALCVGTDTAGRAVFSNDPAASDPTWHAPAEIDGTRWISAISCPSLDLCVAVDRQGHFVRSTDPASASPSWSASIDIDGETELRTVSCTSDELCLAADGEGRALISTDPAAAAPTWSAPMPVGSGPIYAAACSGRELCVAFTEGGAAVTTDPTAETPTWSDTETGAAYVLSASCPSTGLCVAVGLGGEALISTDPTSPTPKWNLTQVDKDGGLVSVSCPSTELCVADGEYDKAVTTTNPAAASPTWSAPVRIDSVERSPEGGLQGVSCASSELCVAVDERELRDLGRSGGAEPILERADRDRRHDCPRLGAPARAGCSAWPSMTPGKPSRHRISVEARRSGTGPWTSTARATWSRCSCPSAELCVAVDAGGNAFATTDPLAEAPSWSETAAVNGEASSRTSHVPPPNCASPSANAR